MSEQEIIQSTRQPGTVNSMTDDFRAMGIEAGDTVLVHSSLSRIGWVCGAETAVIQALLKTVGPTGTLVMPTHSSDNSDPAKWENPPVPVAWQDTIYASMPVYDKQTTPTRGMGRIADRFRTYPNASRSDHPQVSFCASGRLCDEIVADHPLTPQFGPDSPLGRLYRLDAKILLLGIGYESCTSFHYAEYLTGKVEKTTMGAAMLIDGHREWVWFEDLGYDSDDFESIGRDFDKSGSVSFGKTGNADCRLFPMRTSVDFAAQWLLTRRYGKTAE